MSVTEDSETALCVETVWPTTSPVRPSKTGPPELPDDEFWYFWMWMVEIGWLTLKLIKVGTVGPTWIDIVSEGMSIPMASSGISVLAQDITGATGLSHEQSAGE